MKTTAINVNRYLPPHDDRPVRRVLSCRNTGLESPRSIVRATLLGAASSSCLYAAVAMARSAVRKGANFTASMTFQFAATHLVHELAILIAWLISWPFAAAEALGGLVMIAVVAILFRWLMPRSLEHAAIEQAKRGVAGQIEGHADMSMAEPEGNWRARLCSRKGWIAISHSDVMTWAMLWRDIGVVILVAAALSAWVPDSFWQPFFLAGHPLLSALWGAFAGPLIALASFTCPVGSIPLAGVLWRGGISFGGSPRSSSAISSSCRSSKSTGNTTARG